MSIKSTEEEIKITKPVLLLKVLYKYIIYQCLILDLLLTIDMSLNKSHNLSKPQFLILQNEDISFAYFT